MGLGEWPERKLSCQQQEQGEKLGLPSAADGVELWTPGTPRLSNQALQLRAGRGPPAHLSSGGGRRSRWSSLTYTWQVEHAREASQAPGDSK